MTHTYAILAVSRAAYEEIAERLRQAGWTEAFHDDGDGPVIDLNGLAIQAIVTEETHA